LEQQHPKATSGSECPPPVMEEAANWGGLALLRVRAHPTKRVRPEIDVSTTYGAAFGTN
jgi:hypothetical protein